MRLFIAIDIDDAVKAAIVKLQQRMKQSLRNGNGLKWVEPEQMHLTLKFLGEVNDGRLDEIAETINIACLEKRAFEFELSAVGTFGRPSKVLWLGSEKQSGELLALVDSVELALQELGFEKENRPFSAHLTLARVKDNCIEKNLRRVVNENQKVEIPMVLVGSVCLYKSQLTLTGPVYTLLRKIELKKDF
ncbi:MAG: RNA 2',3'-cyclic phosphodiesterase [Phycisphaerae bacterium]|jgi:2'-5' RNA ligase